MKILLSSVLLFILLALAGCSWQQQDRCWISPSRYKEVKKLYEKSASLELVRQTLQDENWLPGEINEAIYRLRKEYHLEEQ